VEELEAEAGQQGAFNPETGEINWDCPCLGGMAHGPCGEEFKAAFSCFVYSKEEPKGVECIDKFKYVFSFMEEDGDFHKAERLTLRQAHARLLQTASGDVRFRVGGR
jgi:intermembrane space import and assembly protein 40